MASETHLNFGNTSSDSQDVAVTVPTTPNNVLVAKIASCRGYGTSVILVSTGLPFTNKISQAGPATGEYSEIWTYVNPPTGAQTVRGTIWATASSSWGMMVSVVSGVSPSTPCRAVTAANGAQGTSTTPALAGFGSAAGDLAVDCLLFITNTTLTPTAGQTQTFNAYSGPWRACSSNKPGNTPTAAMSWTSSGSEKWAYTAVSFCPLLEARGRIVAYKTDRWDPNQRITDAQGAFVAPCDVDADQWTHYLGRTFPTSQTYSDLMADPSMEYNEEVTWRDDSAMPEIKGARGQMNDVIAARLAGGSTA